MAGLLLVAQLGEQTLGLVNARDRGGVASVRRPRCAGEDAGELSFRAFDLRREFLPGAIDREDGVAGCGEVLRHRDQQFVGRDPVGTLCAAEQPPLVKRDGDGGELDRTAEEELR
jgi:hypothetical protein